MSALKKRVDVDPPVICWLTNIEAGLNPTKDPPFPIEAWWLVAESEMAFWIRHANEEGVGTRYSKAQNRVHPTLDRAAKHLIDVYEGRIASAEKIAREAAKAINFITIGTLVLRELEGAE